ncbi:conserved hypothetical protein [Candidatus Methylobacter favarea]|uniref:DUF883 domain-containing protein n=1 Tax=Candidatus Methylobacter favarea TaxID=2707345 RepID=A0A8S0XL09_9GAMM|nr:DUF883 family protein [Candidatus Methylobacter favarea]CAA9892462.1 conserved hypothetical protein [Candidatus Methylobacter favarea]
MEATEKNINVDETVNRLRSGAHDTVDKVADATSQAAEVLNQKGEQLKNAEQQFVENCRGYVHENPVASLGIAVGVGFLLSRLMSGR